MLTPRIVELTDSCLGLKNGNRVFTSLEGENPGGSIKDHMVLGELRLLQKLKDSGIQGVSEVSAGSTAASLAHYCDELSLKCVLFVPTTTNEEVIDSLRAKGAEVYREELSIVYNSYDRFMESRPDLFRFNQLFDDEKRKHYWAFGAAIRQRMGRVDSVFGAVGTGHSLRGISEGVGNTCHSVTTEPDASYKIPGVRNLELNRYGPLDTLAPAHFTQRIIVAEKEISRVKTLRTDFKDIEVNPSFALVLGGLEPYLSNKTEQSIFAIGASLKTIKL